jgi:hypothetical protein
MNKSSMQTPSSTGHATGQDTNKIVDQAKQAVTHVAGDVAERALDQVNTQFDSRKEKAVETIGTVASAIRETGAKLKGVGPLADVAGQAADGVEKFADFFEGKQVGDVLRDVERFARREPAIFIGAAFAVGLVGGRFLKSSAHRNGGDFATETTRSRDHGYGYKSAPPRTPPQRFSAEGSSQSASTSPALGTSEPKNGFGGGTSGSV